ncbi:hypothetical protein [Haloplanus natans]|nr:hypothetical protein [Haloplanus natans]
MSTLRSESTSTVDSLASSAPLPSSTQEMAGVSSSDSTVAVSSFEA